MNDPAVILAEQWHSGQWSGLYAFQCGARDNETLDDAAREFRKAAPTAETDQERSALLIAADYCEGMKT